MGKFTITILSLALALFMLSGLVPGMNMTAYAGTATYTNLIPTDSDTDQEIAGKQVTFNGYKWYIIQDDSTSGTAGTLMLLAAQSLGRYNFNDSISAPDANDYSNSKVLQFLAALTEESGTFYSVRNAIETISSLQTCDSSGNVLNTAENVKLYLLGRYDQACLNLPAGVRKFERDWWLRSPAVLGDKKYAAVCVRSGGAFDIHNVIGELAVRPALTLNLSSVVFSSDNQTFLLNVESIKLNKDKTELEVGKTETLTATVTPEENTDQTVTWKSDKPGVATVDSNGKVTAVTAGTATITATAINGTADESDDKFASCNVTVKEKKQTITVSDVTATYGDTDRKISAATDGNGEISYAVKDGSEDYIDVAADGKLTFKKVGTAAVVVTAAKTATYAQAAKEVTVTIAQKVVGLRWSGTKLTYSGKAQKPVATATGLAKGDKCTVTVSGQKTKVGSYTAKAAKLSNSNYRLPAKNTVSFSIVKAPQAAPAAPVVTKVTNNAVTVKTNTGEQYSIDGKQWQKGGTFRNLSPGTKYKVRARKAETKTQKASSASVTAVKTKALSDKLALERGLKLTQTGSRVNVKWGLVDEADSYEVYAQYCGKKFDKKPTVTVKDGRTGSVSFTEIGGKKLNLSGKFRVVVLAKKDGKTLARSLACHAAGRKNRKYTNAKAIELKKDALTLKAGGSAQAKAKVVLADEGRQLLSEAHVQKFRYETTDKNVASVDGSGRITAAGKGTCAVYVFAINGFAKKITVTVK